MAKLFYTLDEVCAKLSLTAEAVTALVKEKKIHEYRFGEELVFKVQEIDLMADDSRDGMELSIPDNLSAGSDSFELDLSDSAENKNIDSGKSGSPVGLPAVTESEEMSMALDFDDQPLTTPSAAAVPPAILKIEAEAFGLDLGASGSMAAASGASASHVSIPESASAQDEMTLELDLGDDFSADVAAPNRVSKTNLDDSIGSMAAAPTLNKKQETAPLTFEDSAAGVGASRADSAIDSSISEGISFEVPGSGSGLLDLTSDGESDISDDNQVNDSDSSSIGAALMDDVFSSSEESSEIPANASGIFGSEGGGESGAGIAVIATGVAVATTAGKLAKSKSTPIFTSGAIAGEVYSGTWSGLGAGLLIPSFLGLAAAFAMVLIKTLGAPPDLAVMYSQDWMMYTGILAGAIALCGAIGFFVGKATSE